MADTHPSLKLSAVEQSGPRGYIRPLFFFPLEERNNDVLSLLEAALELTKKAIPVLTAEMFPDTESQQKGRFNLHSDPDTGVLVKKDLRGGLSPLTYRTLKEQGFPAAALSQDVLCPVPVFPMHAPPIPVFAAQATLVDGGVILNICIMHLVADARAIYEILKTWAQNCRHLQDPSMVPTCEQLPLSVFEKKSFEHGAETPDAHPEYLIFDSPPAPPPAMFRQTFRTRVYRIPAANLIKLKEDASFGMDDGEHISTNDAVCALVWRCVLAAQVELSNVTQDTVSLNTICVDGRSRCFEPLREDHIGCPMVYATPCIDIHETLATNSLKKVACAIRKAIIGTNKDYIASLISFLNGIHSYDCIAPASFAGLMNTSVMTTSWFRIPFYDIHWGPVFGGGHCDRVRTVHEGFFNGSQVILPVLSNNDMEVVIGLDQEHWERFERDELWARYATMR
ncbi:hypothetical protein KCU98_g12281, partial [Aureobasidium melanogenum]